MVIDIAKYMFVYTRKYVLANEKLYVIGGDGGAYGEYARNKVPWKNIIVKTLNADADASDIHNIVLNISPSITLIAFPLILFL